MIQKKKLVDIDKIHTLSFVFCLVYFYLTFKNKQNKTPLCLSCILYNMVNIV